MDSGSTKLNSYLMTISNLACSSNTHDESLFQFYMLLKNIIHFPKKWTKNYEEEEKIRLWVL